MGSDERRRVIAERIWASVDDKGVKGRLYREDCDYLARVVEDFVAPVVHIYHGDCPESGLPDQRDPACPACAALPLPSLGEGERSATAEDTAALLVLVEDEFPGPVPTVEEIEGWDCVTRSQVAAWAFAVYLVASDNHVGIPPMPDALNHARGRA